MLSPSSRSEPPPVMLAAIQIGAWLTNTDCTMVEANLPHQINYNCTLTFRLRVSSLICRQTSSFIVICNPGILNNISEKWLAVIVVMTGRPTCFKNLPPGGAWSSGGATHLVPKLATGGAGCATVLAHPVCRWRHLP